MCRKVGTMLRRAATLRGPAEIARARIDGASSVFEEACVKSFCGLLCLAVLGTTLLACGDDDDSTTDGGSGVAGYGGSGDNAGQGGHAGAKAKDAGSDTGSGGKGGPKAPHDAGPDAAIDSGSTDAGHDSGSDNEDAGDDEDGGTTPTGEFHVPSGGGEFKITTSSGVKLIFDFPASAGGKDITVTSVDPSSVSFGASDLDGKFSDVIELGPSGTTFTDPVKVKVGKGSLIVFNFHDPAKPADPLLLSADGASLALTHFSTLAVVAPNQSCQSESGWHDDPADQQSQCTGQGTSTTARSYGCKNLVFCYVVAASCCVDPGDPDTDCQVGDKALTLFYRRTDSNGGAYPYCDEAGGVGNPYVQTITPSTLLPNSQDQQLVLTGSSFIEGGSVYYGSNTYLDTTFVSATEVHATVPGSALTTAGTLSEVAYANPKPGAAACTAQATSNCDTLNASNRLNVPITQ
jgi:hypothetical protein